MAVAAAAHLEERHEVSWRVAQDFLGSVICKLGERLTLYVRVQALHVAQTPANRELCKEGIMKQRVQLTPSPGISIKHLSTHDLGFMSDHTGAECVRNEDLNRDAGMACSSSVQTDLQESPWLCYESEH